MKARRWLAAVLGEVVLAFFRTFLVVTDPTWGVPETLRRRVHFRMFCRHIAGVEEMKGRAQESVRVHMVASWCHHESAEWGQTGGMTGNS